MVSAMLEVKSVSKHYDVGGRRVTALREISFSLESPQIVGIMGRSGCGKTTLLKIIAGLIPPSAGSVFLNGERITQPTRKIGMVFQNYVTFPWLSVEDNIRFGLRINNYGVSQINTIIEKMLRATQLERHRKKYPESLSGGEKQRLAVAKALAIEPEVLLMDEPFASLDQETKHQMRTLIRSIWDVKPFKLIFVTHDNEDAKVLSHSIIRMIG